MDSSMLKNLALEAGFDGTFVADVLEKLGPEVLQLLIDGLKGGFSVAFLQEVLQKLGPTVLQLVTGFGIHTASTGVAASLKTGAILRADEVPLLNASILSSILQSGILKKWLPVLLEKYGPQIIDAVIQHLLNLPAPTN